MHGRARVFAALPELARQAQGQSGVVTRRQLASHGVDNKAVIAQISALRWAALGPVLVVMHRGPLSDAARRWAAVLHAGPSAGLCAWSAAAQWGLRGWTRDQIHVVVTRGATPFVLPWVRLHESRRHTVEDLVVPSSGPPLHAMTRAAVDAAAWERSARSACGLLAAAVQQRLTTTTALFEALAAAGRVQHRKVMAASLLDIEGGADALSEVDFGQLCARAGLPAPVRQAVRTDAQGRRRYRDIEWRRADGRLVVGEIDGVGHMEVRRWYDDLLREADLAVVEGDALRFRLPALAVRAEPARVVALLRRLLLVQTDLSG